LAAQQPVTPEKLGELRTSAAALNVRAGRGDSSRRSKRALAIPRETLAEAAQDAGNEGTGAAVDLSNVLLKMVSEDHGVAPKVIARRRVGAIAADDEADVPALQGCAGLFGETALRLKRGDAALPAPRGKEGRLVELRRSASDAAA